MRFRELFVSVLILLMMPPRVTAIPGDVHYAENFEDGTTGGWTKTVGDPAYPTFGVNQAFTDYAAFVAGENEVRAISPKIDLSGLTGARVVVTVTRGANIKVSGVTLSNRPDNGENFELEYLDDTGAWQVIATHPGGNPPGEVFNDVIDLPASALHADFRLRAGTWGGDAWDGEVDDFWHFDDIQVIETSTASGDLSACTLGEDFENGLSGWTAAGNTVISGATYRSSSNSALLPAGGSTLTSAAMDLSGKTATISAWVRAGGWPGGPDKPESADTLEFQYLKTNGQWQAFYTICKNCSGGGSVTAVDDGGVALYSGDLPAAAMHANFQLRLANTSTATSATLDAWFVDDLCITATSPVDHFSIEHDGSGINCQPEFIDIVAHDVGHNVALSFAGGVSLSTSTTHGDWSTAVAAGTLTNNGSGSASYAFNTSDNGKVTLKLANTYIETPNIDISDGSHNEHATEDPDLPFAQSGFQFVTPGGAAQIGRQIAGKPSDTSPANAIELQAIRTNDATGACEAAFVGNTVIDLALTCETPGNCSSSIDGIVNGTSIASNASGVPVSWTSLAVNFGDNTDDTAPLVFQYDNAGGVRLHARKSLSPSGEVMSGSSNIFIVKPFGLDVTVDQGSITNINPAASGPGGSGFERAGEPFRVTVRAVGWQSADDANADGIPDGHDDAEPSNNANLTDNVVLPNFAQESSPDTVALDRALVAPAGGSNPALNGTLILNGFNNGSAASNNLRWQEVGVIEIIASLNDDDYLGAGAIHGRSGYVGRFVPHHFTTVVDDHGCSNAAAFTWSKQPLRKLTITAFAEDNSTAENFGYSGGSGFATDITLSDPSAPSPGSFNSIVSRTTFSTGVAELDDTISFGFSAVETAPYALTIRATDADGGSSDTFAEDQTEIRSGRLILGYAAAPVMVDARGEIDTHRWNGSAWQIETDDSCTGLAIATTDFGYSDFQLNLADGESAASNIGFYGGEGLVRFSSPGIGNDGSMRATLDVPEWLEFDWTGDSVPDDPFNTILFVPKHAREAGLIDLQEVVQ